jgi:hypothetical protein
MSISDWAALHGETGEIETDLIRETTDSYAFYVNEHLDYEVLFNIRVFANGEVICEIEDQLLNIFDDEGTLIRQFSVKLPSKYVQDAVNVIQRRYEP